MSSKGEARCTQVTQPNHLSDVRRVLQAHREIEVSTMKDSVGVILKNDVVGTEADSI